MRINASLKIAAEVLGTDRRVVVAREISKVFEEVVSEPLGSLISRFEERSKKDGRLKGEFTLIVGPSLQRKEKKKKK